VNVYFPCADGSVKYRIELGNCLGFIESVITQNGNTIILGDMNFQCTDDNVGFRLCNPVFRQLDLYNCDALCSSREQCTYYNEALGLSSFIDHMFVSRQIFQDCCNVDIIDSGCNLSDHRPIVAKFNFVLDSQARNPNHKVSKSRILNWRWDKSDLSTYYEESRCCLNNIAVPECTRCIGHMCCDYSHHVSIDHYYRDIVKAIHMAASKTVVRIPHKSLKPFWNEELDKLKQDSIFWYNVWVSAGKPHQGTLRSISISCKLKYKSAIRDAYVQFEQAHDDAIIDSFRKRNVPDFWKAWSAKFKKKLSTNVVFNNCTDDVDTANMFAERFSSIFCDSAADSAAVQAFQHLHSSVMADNPESITPTDVSIELVEDGIRRLKRGKACGPDDLGAEHLLYAHPSLIVHLKLLFGLVLSHSYVPADFGLGCIIPLVKDKSLALNNAHNYRAVTLIPVISKVLENVIFSICEEKIITSSLQFGFKANTGCSDAIFALRSTVDHFTTHNSNVFAASLDINKAFDKINHFKLFSSLYKTGVPMEIVFVLVNWYGKLCAVVRWNGAYSSLFVIRSGVRQGSALSPALFNLFINVLINSLYANGVGCWVKQIYMGCIMYADDIILLSPTVQGLQDMLNVCYSVSSELSLQFNPNKCHLIAFGPLAHKTGGPLLIGSDNIDWTHSVKYLGVHIICGRKLSFDINPIKRAFFTACNSVCSQSQYMDEILQLSLIERYCLPILTYAAPAVSLKTRQLNELNSCWNSAYRRVFGFHRWESVRSFICGLGRLDLKHVIMLRKCRWLCKIRTSQNSLILNLFWVNVLDSKNVFLLAALGRYPEAVERITQMFSDSCAVG